MTISTARPAVGFIGLGDHELPMAIAITKAGYPAPSPPVMITPTAA